MTEEYPFLNDDLLRRTPPENYRERVIFLARTLAYGAAHDYWSPRFSVKANHHNVTDPEWYGIGAPEHHSRLWTYLKQRWNFKQPDPAFLLSFEYAQLLSEQRHPQSGFYTRDFLLTPQAFALLEQPLERKVFISYRRGESSAFALLLRDRLQREGFDVFIDMQKIEPGEIWRERLKTEIEAADLFLCLVGPTTLDSEFVREEIRWAWMKPNRQAIAIWHNGYVYDGKTYSEFAPLLSERNAIIINPEHVLSYDNALTQLIQFLRPL